MFAARLELALHYSELRKNGVPFRFQPADILIGELAHTAHRGAPLQHIHRFARKFVENAQLVKDVRGLLQEIGTNVGELPFLLRGNDRLRLIKPVRDEIVKLLPVL